MATIYAILIIQYKFKYHRLFSANFYKINEDDQRIDETEIIIIFNNNHNLTEIDIDKIDIKSQLKHQIQYQETKKSGWTFGKINSMKMRFHKTGELTGSSYVKVPLRSHVLINVKKNDK